MGFGKYHGMRRTGITIPKNPRRNDFNIDICANCGHTRANHKRVLGDYGCQFELELADKPNEFGRFKVLKRCDCKKFVPIKKTTENEGSGKE